MQIPLTQNQYAIVDEQDFDRLNQYKWNADWSPKRKVFTPVRTEKIEGEWVKIYMHREIIEADKSMDIDHINHNTLDNRRENLRVCTRKENSYNQRISSRNTSGYKGVFRQRSIKETWIARIVKDYKGIHLGSFGDKIEAAKAYNKAATELFGEFAYLNKIK